MDTWSSKYIKIMVLALAMATVALAGVFLSPARALVRDELSALKHRPATYRIDLPGEAGHPLVQVQPTERLRKRVLRDGYAGVKGEDAVKTFLTGAMLREIRQEEGSFMNTLTRGGIFTVDLDPEFERDYHACWKTCACTSSITEGCACSYSCRIQSRYASSRED